MFSIVLLSNSQAQSNFSFELDQEGGFKDSRNPRLDDSAAFPPILELKDEVSQLSIHPILEYLYASDNLEGNLQRWGLGAASRFRSKKWQAGLTFFYNKGEYMTYQEERILERGVISAFGNKEGNQLIQSRFWDGYLSFQPNNIFDFEIGYGRKFIGDGHRSLLNSDYTSPYPYLKIQTKFWKLTYTNLFAMQSNTFGVVDQKNLHQKKYTASHYLELQLHRKFRIGLFETVVWQADEGSYYRGMDPNYLNPVIFYRPVEFSIGSSDNVLIGANLAYQPFPQHQFYFQAMLDEFLLSEIRADVSQKLNEENDIRSGWWGNKYAMQIGWKGEEFFGMKNWSARLEYNLARPYTYAHSSPSQAYTHNSMALAHPLGANFEEGLVQLKYQKKKWSWSAQYNQIRRGRSFGGLNFGEDPEVSNQSRVKEYENFIAQGVLEQNKYFETTLSRRMKVLWGAELSVGYVWRQSESASRTSVNNMVFVGLRSNLIRQRFDY